MITPPRKNQQKSFFKYMSAETAKIVLINKTLRWSSPLEFNDPFDVPRELAFNISHDEMQEATVEALINLIKKPPGNTDHLEPKVKYLLDATKDLVSPSKKQKLIAVIREANEQLKTPHSTSFDELRDMWRQMIPQFRILCLSEEHDVVSMWYHYANKYTGVVIEFLCDDDVPSAWLMASRVNYEEPTPNLYKATGWAELMIYRSSIREKLMYEILTHTKSEDWKYEKEWRIAQPARPGETGTISDYEFLPREIGRVFLGPLISDIDKTDILNITRAMTHVPLSESSIGFDRNFTFKQIQKNRGQVCTLNITSSLP